MRSLFLCPALWYNGTKPFTEQENHHAQGFTGRSLRPHRFYPHRAPACPGRGVFVCLRGLRRLLPEASRDPETLAAISANLSANLLGLGNAATPLGIRAARRMAQGCGGTASHELCLLVVLNSASIQLLPTTVAGVRSALGSADPFDILPAVWTASLLSVLAGLAAAKLFARIWRG